MRSVEEHRARVLAPLAPLPARSLPLRDAVGCVLAEDVVSPGPLPAFDVSAMDGYAVHSADVAGDLPVVADLAAGVLAVADLAPGTAARIMTGAPVPTGADAVVPVEWTAGWAPADGTGTVRVAVEHVGDVVAGLHVRRAGEGVAAGERVLPRSAVVGPRQVALLAAVGRASVLVHPRPRVAVLSTGSELVEPGRPVAFGQINDSNSLSLAAAATAMGAQVVSLGHVGDEPDALLAALRAAAASADVVVTSGGVSAGAYDVVKEVLSRDDVAAVEFVKVAMQPGMPQGVGTIDATPLLTLPGNPVSAWLSAEVFVRPVLARLRGLPDDHPATRLPTVRAVAAVGWSSPAGKLQFTRAVLDATAGAVGGLPRVRPVGGPGSHLVGDLAVATHLALVPRGVGAVAVGDELTCWVLDGAS